MIETLCYGDRKADYWVTTTPRLSSKILIHVEPNGAINVEAPIDSDRLKIKAAIQKRARWVFDNLDIANSARTYALPREYIGGETHFYLGRRHRLMINGDISQPTSVKLTRGRIVVTNVGTEPSDTKRCLQLWYRTRAKIYLTRRLCEITSTVTWLNKAPLLKIVPMEHQWGSCTPSGSIHLNPALIRAPRHCIDYVIIHELCHLREHNHSNKFYALLRQESPNWETTKAELDAMSELLLVC